MPGTLRATTAALVPLPLVALVHGVDCSIIRSRNRWSNINLNDERDEILTWLLYLSMERAQRVPRLPHDVEATEGGWKK